MNPGRVQLHINELVLHGFSGIDRHELDASVRQELARLVSQHGMPSHLQRSDTALRVDAGDLTMPSNAGSEAAGKQVARAIFGGGSP